jgi:lysozyme
MTTLDTAALRADLTADEGVKLKVYTCPAGKLTIGVGRNVEDLGITLQEAMYLLDGDIARVSAELDRNAPWWRQMSEPRQRALANMCFQLGWPRLSRFVRMLAAMQAGQWDRAAVEARDSLWFRQTQASRTRRVINAIREG